MTQIGTGSQRRDAFLRRHVFSAYRDSCVTHIGRGRNRWRCGAFSRTNAIPTYNDSHITHIVSGRVWGCDTLSRMGIFYCLFIMVPIWRKLVQSANGVTHSYVRTHFPANHGFYVTHIGWGNGWRRGTFSRTNAIPTCIYSYRIHIGMVRVWVCDVLSYRGPFYCLFIMGSIWRKLAQSANGVMNFYVGTCFLPIETPT